MKYFFALLVATLLSATLHAEAFVIKKYDVTIDVQTDGSFRVRETIEVRFSEKRHGIFRSIPYRYRLGEVNGEQAIRNTNRNGYYETLLKDVSVKGRPFQISKEDSYLKIRIGSPNKKVSGTQIYEIEYTVYGAVNQFKNHQEFNWNITGVEWQTSVQQVNFIINFPQNAALKSSDVICYTGRNGAQDKNATYQVTADQIQGSTTKRLKSREGVSIAIRLPVDYFSQTEIPLSAYANNFIVEKHTMKVDLLPSTALEILETYDVNFLNPVQRFSRHFNNFRTYHSSPQKELSIFEGRQQFPMIAEEELLVETTPAIPIQLVVNRRRMRDYIDISTVDQAFTGKVKIQIKYLLWGTAKREGDQTHFNCEIVKIAADEPLATSEFEINIPEGVQLDENKVRIIPDGKNVNWLSLIPQVSTEKITGKLKKTLLHGEGFAVNFTTDSKGLDFTAVPIEIYAEHYIMDYFKTDIYLQKDGSARIEYALEPNFIYQSADQDYFPYIQKRYQKAAYDLPNHGLLSPKYRPLISEVINPNPEKYDLRTDGDQHYFYLKNADINDWDIPFQYSYHIDGIQTTADDKYKINFPVIYPSVDPTRRGSFRVHFPSEIDPEAVTAEVVTSTGRTVGNINKDRQMVAGIIDEILLPDEAVVLSLTYPKAYTGSSWGSWFKLILVNNPFFIFAFIGIGLLYLLWYFMGRDEKHPLMVRFHPPDDITPAEAGLLWDGKLHQKDLISLIYYWAANGHLTIREEGSGSKKEYTLLKKSPLPTTAHSFEQTIFNGFFASKDSVKISSLRDSFYKKIKKAHHELIKHSKEKGFYVSGSRGLGKTLLFIGIVLAFGSIVLFIFGIINKDFSIAVPGFLLSAALIFFGYYMPKKAPFGSKKFSEILGFREFVKTAEIDRLRVLATEDSRYFEGTIAYAIVFGLGKEWARKFKDLAIPAPDWYEGQQDGTFHPILFTDNMMSSMNRMNTDLTYVKPAPSTSSGSGGSSFGGGGSFSSGGGFGGGGGGSW